MKLKVNFDKFSQNSLLYEKVVHDIIYRWCQDLHILFKTIFNVTYVMKDEQKSFLAL